MPGLRRSARFPKQWRTASGDALRISGQILDTNQSVGVAGWPPRPVDEHDRRLPRETLLPGIELGREGSRHHSDPVVLEARQFTQHLSIMFGQGDHHEGPAQGMHFVTAYPVCFPPRGWSESGSYTAKHIPQPALHVLAPENDWRCVGTFRHVRHRLDLFNVQQRRSAAFRAHTRPVWRIPVIA